MIGIGPRGQEIVRRYLKTDLHAYLFSPRESLQAYRIELRRNRKTKVQPSQENRRKQKPKRAPGEQYTRRAYAYRIVLPADRSLYASLCDYANS